MYLLFTYYSPTIHLLFTYYSPTCTYVKVYALSRDGEEERFRKAGCHTMANRTLLWHGSRLSNWVGILSDGMRIAPPEAPANGYLFDKGLYVPIGGGA